MRHRVHKVSRWVVLLSIVSTSILGYASTQILDEDAFASLLSESIDEPEVRVLLAEKAVDVALDASNADAALADALPDEISLVATPAIELVKPTVAEAGAGLLGVGAVEESLEAAARSIHRQTVTSVLAEEETDVSISALPVLVVVADGIAGDAGARAVVGLDLPEDATQIDLGTNRSALWSAIRSLSVAAGLSALVWLLAIVLYLATAPTGHRLLAIRRLGYTWMAAGLVVLLLAWILLLIVAGAAMVMLSPGEEITFSAVSVGGVSVEGSMSLASVLLGPLLASAGRTMIIGGVLVAASIVLGSGSVAVALRQAIKQRDLTVLREATIEALPTHLRRTRLAVWLGLIVLLLVWPDLAMRVALTFVTIGALGLGVLWLLASTSQIAHNVRGFVGAPEITQLDETERSPRAQTIRRWLRRAGLLLVVLWPDYSLRGFVLLIVVISVAMVMTHWWEDRPARAATDLQESLSEDPSVWSRRSTAIVAVAAVVCLLVLFTGRDSVPAVSASELSSGAPGACNGLESLCDRRLDEVAFAGTHNSMSSSELGWELANHGPAIPAQLDGGIRALLIDVQRWTDSGNLDAFAGDPAALAIAEAALASGDAPEDGLWMCHKFCQLGGTPFGEFLGDLRAFVETHPDEVLIVVIQDEADAESIKAAIADAGLVDFTFEHEPGTDWPTLGQMITMGKRLVFLAENEGESTGWYQSAFDGNVSETGFAYSVVEDFECSANRGGDDGSLFMINHWVETGLPIPSEADEVNSSAVLEERVATCQQVRDRSPGIIAVNFWERGDLLAFVDEFNGAE